MKLCSILSGSSGNCVYVESEKARILIDAGGSGRVIQNGLLEAGIDPKSLDAILVTHEHGDHIKGVGILSRRLRIPVYANKDTWNAMWKRLGKISKDHQVSFRNHQPFQIKDITITPFSVHHDAVNPVGYIFTKGNEKISVMTDTGFIDERMMNYMHGSQIYYFESNHDVDMLMTGPYPPDLKERILSTHGHLSNVQAANALCDLLQGQNEVVLLAHMSIENNEEVLCHQTVIEILNSMGLDTDKHQKIVVAPRYQPSKLYSCNHEPQETLEQIEFPNQNAIIIPGNGPLS